MANWDIFHTDRLQAERSLSTEAVRAAVASGAIRPDDLVRPAGSSDAWARVGDTPALMAPPAGAREPKKSRPAPPPAPPASRPASGPPASRPASGPPASRSPSGPPAARPASGPPAKPSPPEGPSGDRARAGAPAARSGSPSPPPRKPVRKAEVPDEGEDFDDSIPAPPEAAKDEKTVELPPRSAPTSPKRPEPTPSRGAAGAGAAASAGAGAGLAGEVEDSVEAIPAPGLSDRGAAPVVETSAESLSSAELFGLFDPVDEDEEAAAFTLAAEPTEEPDEIDLTAMVDVAFQLVLFFLVTATTLYFKTLEIPTPDPEDPDAVAQQMRTLDDLLDEYILVEIDPQGRIQIDREPIDLTELTDRLRQARADTLRTGMLLMADFATPHRNAVSAIDSANALGLQIAIAKPASPPQ